MTHTPTTQREADERTNLLSIGGQMANVMFNLAQRPGEPLTGDIVATMDSLRKQWDAARRALPTTPAAATDQPSVGQVDSILPCPFCGERAASVHEHFTGASYMVMCSNCTAEGPLVSTGAQAKIEWNRRASLTPTAPQAASQQAGVAMRLLREARAALETWKDVAPAVSLCADIDKFLAPQAASTASASRSAPKIKTWQERMPVPRIEYQCSMNCSPKSEGKDCGDCNPVTVHGDPTAARDAEIADLRAALAHAPQAPTADAREGGAK